LNPGELKATLKKGLPVFGCMLSIMEGMRWGRVLASSTLDYVVIDTEHGSRSRTDTAALVMMVKAAGLTAIVRVADTDPVFVAMALDAGADGVLVPYMEEVEEVKECAYKLRLHPLKGQAFRNVVEKGEFPSDKSRDYLARRHSDNLFIMGIESKTAVNRLEELLDCAEIDAVFVGPNDLSTSLGDPDNLRSDDYVNALKRVITVSEARGVPVMVHHQNQAMSIRGIELGARFVLHSSDGGMLRNAMNNEFAVLREAASKRWGGQEGAEAEDHMEVV
jgi:4-hydroxy-2-oxoheptanedioate aldolase